MAPSPGATHGTNRSDVRTGRLQGCNNSPMLRSLHAVRRARPARRSTSVVLAVTVLTTLLHLVAWPTASADDTAEGDGSSRTAPMSRGADPRLLTSARTNTNPDFIDMPEGCFTEEPSYALTPKPCRLTPHRKGAPLIVLWGDSHAWMLTPAIRKAVRAKKVNVVSLMQGGCPPMFSDLSTPEKLAKSNGCDDFGHYVIDYLDKARRAKRPLRLVVAMAWELYHNVTDAPNGADKKYPGFTNDYISDNARKSLAGTPRAFRALGRMHIKTDIVAAEPMIYQTAPFCPSYGFLCPLPRQAVLKDAKENNARIREMRSLLTEKGIVIRPAKTLCTTTVCRGVIDGVPVHYDRIHLGQRASWRLSGHFAPTISAVLAEARAARSTR